MRKPFVVCVDDEKIVLDSLKQQLKNYFNSSIDIETVESGEEALEVFEDYFKETGNEPHIVISDQIMPNMSGDELLCEIHRLYPLTKKILLTGQADKSDLISAVNNADLYRFIEKPWDIVDLGLTVKEAIALFDKNKLILEQREELLDLNQNLEVLVKQRTLELEVKNEEVFSGIRYAKKIQEGILPDFINVLPEFKDGFLLHKPLTFLSGDFFWHAKVDHKTILSVVDCTGHGVPAALMSVVGNSLLNEIVLINKITDPGTILRELHKGVSKVLCQDSSDIEDGMDIAMVCVDTQKQVLSFSGARNPLMYFSGEEMNIVKGGNISIGGITEIERDYCTTNITLSAVDSFYLFSDGFQDQFGGERNKKFSVRRFRELISTVRHHQMEKQCSVLMDTFNIWKDEEDQLDDVMVVGVRLK